MGDTPSWRSNSVPPHTVQNSKSLYPACPGYHEHVPWGFLGLGVHWTRRLHVKTRPSCSMKDPLPIPQKTRPGYTTFLCKLKSNLSMQFTVVNMHLCFGMVAPRFQSCIPHPMCIFMILPCKPNIIYFQTSNASTQVSQGYLRSQNPLVVSPTLINPCITLYSHVSPPAKKANLIIPTIYGPGYPLGVSSWGFQGHRIHW